MVIHAFQVLLAATACMASVVAVAPASTAEELTHDDFRHDVRFGEDDLAPRQRDPDILRVRVGHRERALVVRVTFDQLDRHPGKSWSILLHVRAPDSPLYRIGAGSTGGKAEWYFSRGFTDTTCAAMTGKIAWRLDFFRVRVPRTCLGTPEWVRVGVLAHRSARFGEYSDDGFSKWGGIYGFAPLPKSRRVYSG